MRNVETTAFNEPDGGIRVHIQEDTCEIVLHFSDFAAKGDPRRLEINPRRTAATLHEYDLDEVERVSTRIDPAIVRRVGRNYQTYLTYARAFLRFDRNQTRRALRTLGRAGRTRRGLSVDFISAIADDHRELIAAGERYPVKALAQLHNVEISTASRWLSRARELDLIKEKPKEKR